MPRDIKEFTPWEEGPYNRHVLDQREKWGVVISVTGIGYLWGQLYEMATVSPWVCLAPLAIGLYASLFVLRVNLYYKDAREKQNKREEEVTHDGARTHGGDQAMRYICGTLHLKQNGGSLTADKPNHLAELGHLAWLHVLAPFIFGGIATCTLLLDLSKDEKGPWCFVGVAVGLLVILICALVCDAVKRKRSFKRTITGLIPNTKYKVLVSARNKHGNGQDKKELFTTLPAAKPTITIIDVSNITGTTAVIDVEVTTPGDAPIIDRDVTCEIVQE